MRLKTIGIVILVITLQSCLQTEAGNMRLSKHLVLIERL